MLCGFHYTRHTLLPCAEGSSEALGNFKETFGSSNIVDTITTKTRRTLLR
jgi:hypothetical protein